MPQFTFTNNTYAGEALAGLAVGSAVVTTLQTSLHAGSLNFNWQLIGTVALGAGIAYLGKNFFTPASLKTPAQNQ